MEDLDQTDLKLTPEQKKKLQQALVKANAEGPCPRCGAIQFEIPDELSLLEIVRKPGYPFLTAQRGYLCANIFCSKCGFVAQHALHLLGYDIGKFGFRERGGDDR